MKLRAIAAFALLTAATSARAQAPAGETTVAPPEAKPTDADPAQGEARPQPAGNPDAAAPQHGDATEPAATRERLPASSDPDPEATPVSSGTFRGEADGPTSPVDADAQLPEMLSAAELSELGFSEAAPSVDTDVKLSGFIDFGTQIALNNTSRALTSNSRPSFSIGNLNLYLSKNLIESLRTMIEVRLLFLPNGAGAGLGSPNPVNTQTSDYSDFNRTLRWGGIELERVYLDWVAHPYLTVRTGVFLTPYGVWNVDHGTPAIIPAQRPYVIGIGFFPERQTGFELFGRWSSAGYSTIGYHLTLSNGTGPASEWKDLDRNKAIGGRLYWENRKYGELRVGGSAYYGRDTIGAETFGVNADGEIYPGVSITTQADVLALGTDVVWKFRGVHLQGELLGMQRKHTEEGRAVYTDPFTGAQQFPADSFSWGAYAIAGYRFDWLGIMPFAMFQYIDQSTIPREIFGYHAGLNIRPIDALALKIQYDEVMFPGQIQSKSGENIRMLYLQVAWAF